MRRRARLAALAAGIVLALAGCAGEPPPSVSTDPSTHVTRIDAPITKKEVVPPYGWYFQFDTDDGGYIGVPVSETHYNQFEVGDRVKLECDPGYPCILAND